MQKAPEATSQYNRKYSIKGNYKNLSWSCLKNDSVLRFLVNVIAKSLGELLVKVKTWKSGMLVNMGKTKILMSGPYLDLLKKSGRDTLKT